MRCMSYLYMLNPFEPKAEIGTDRGRGTENLFDQILNPSFIGLQVPSHPLHQKESSKTT